jgi:hypothetical protein
MNAFKNYYNKKDIYILKKNIQRKEGLKLTSDLNTILNAKDESYKVVQKYLTNLYLINKRKVNLRIYLLILIKDNKIYFYMSNIGKCIYTNKEFGFGTCRKLFVYRFFITFHGIITFGPSEKNTGSSSICYCVKHFIYYTAIFISSILHVFPWYAW